MVPVTPAELPTLRQLFDEHARYIWRSLRHLGVAEADIEDVCQEVFLVAHRKLAEFAGRSSLRTWLYGICLRQASDYRRRAYVRRERAMADPVDSARPDAGSAGSENAEARAMLLALLAELDDEKREVVVLYELEGFSMREVADIVGCPLQTAYSRLYAARERLTALAQASESAKS
jgi:RNA polymerase sigma-70 factor (ECF subfamily)